MKARVAEFIASRWALPPATFRVRVRPLHGGLESAVALARVVRRGRSDRTVPRHVIVKALPPGREREARVYAWLWRHVEMPPAVQLLGVERRDAVTYLYLEHAAGPAWPWSDAAHAARVCRELARLHATRPRAVLPAAWDYEAELARSSELTLQLAAGARDPAGRRLWRRSGELRRVVAALPRLRARLLASGTTVIHGDVHPGNVILRLTGDRRVLLIDWARARVGSPFEDLASWLHSLGCWEPEARRRHDTLMRAYLGCRGDDRVTGEVRRDYWIASLSNGLAGAIRYHLAVLGDVRSAAEPRHRSARALTAWERVVRRAAVLLSTSPDRRS